MPPPTGVPEEHADDPDALGGVSGHAWRSQEAVDLVKERVAPYLAEHRASYVDRWLDWDGDDATLVVAFTSSVESHQAALGQDVRVVQRVHTAQALGRIAAGLMAFADEIDGVTPLASWGHPPDDAAYLEAVTKDPDGLRAALADRYGDVVRLEWSGPEEYVVGPVSFDRWDIGADDRTLTVHWLGAGADGARLELDEDPQVVSVGVNQPQFVGAVAAVGVPSSASAILAAPLAGRDVIDASTGTHAPGDTTHPEPATEDFLVHQAVTAYADREFAAASGPSNASPPTSRTLSTTRRWFANGTSPRGI